VRVAVLQRAFRPSYKRRNQSRWVLYAANGKALCNSGETYTNMTDCVSGLNLSLGTVTYSTDDYMRYEVAALKAYRQARGIKPHRIMGFIHRDGEAIAVMDEVRATG
jgi:hypothetical protein